VQMTAEEVVERYARYGFRLEPQEAGQWDVHVPSHRIWDVESRQCLYEELAKSIGFNALPSALPPQCLGSMPTPAEQRKVILEDVLTGAGFYEVMTDGFYARPLL